MNEWYGMCVHGWGWTSIFINLFVFFAIFASYSYWILSSNLLVRMKKAKQMIVICMQHKHFDTDIHSFRCDINYFIYNLFSILTLIQTADTLHFASSLFSLLLFSIDHHFQSHCASQAMNQMTKKGKRQSRSSMGKNWRENEKWSNDHHKSNNFQNHNDDEDNMTRKIRRRRICKQHQHRHNRSRTSNYKFIRAEKITIKTRAGVKRGHIAIKFCHIKRFDAWQFTNVILNEH